MEEGLRKRFLSWGMFTIEHAETSILPPTLVILRVGTGEKRMTSEETITLSRVEYGAG